MDSLESRVESTKIGEVKESFAPGRLRSLKGTCTCCCIHVAWLTVVMYMFLFRVLASFPARLFSIVKLGQNESLCLCGMHAFVLLNNEHIYGLVLIAWVLVRTHLKLPRIIMSNRTTNIRT